jgi:hypothetical protein
VTDPGNGSLSGDPGEALAQAVAAKQEGKGRVLGTVKIGVNFPFYLLNLIADWQDDRIKSDPRVLDFDEAIRQIIYKGLT